MKRRGCGQYSTLYHHDVEVIKVSPFTTRCLSSYVIHMLTRVARSSKSNLHRSDIQQNLSLVTSERISAYKPKYLQTGLYNWVEMAAMIIFASGLIGSNWPSCLRGSLTVGEPLVKSHLQGRCNVLIPLKKKCDPLRVSIYFCFPLRRALTIKWRVGVQLSDPQSHWSVKTVSNVSCGLERLCSKNCHANS